MSGRKLYPLFLLVFMLFSFTACQKKQKITGDEFVDRKVLVSVLVDIHLADGLSNDRKFHRRYDVDSIDILTPILEKHQISRQKFDTTMFVYSRDPELLDQVYSDVLIQLNVMLDEINKDPGINTEE
ncbi:MAG: DUF4296 domain-containing protein [Bacteroidales bacterium]|nr:DUF4296 domain-containing protein [Bacteroidales bacterium]